MRCLLAKFLPEDAAGLLDLMNQRFPEPTFPANATTEEIRWALARRSVYLEMRDAYALAKKRA